MNRFKQLKSDFKVGDRVIFKTLTYLKDHDWHPYVRKIGMHGTIKCKQEGFYRKKYYVVLMDDTSELALSKEELKRE